MWRASEKATNLHLSAQDPRKICR